MKLDETVPWSEFRPILEQVQALHKSMTSTEKIMLGESP
ncbi:hypothetical protein RintRC_3691 [Richelia intracellularis]|nr:hypothetical protein RintRC_3691 [Richelia intracellularis]